MVGPYEYSNETLGSTKVVSFLVILVSISICRRTHIHGVNLLVHQLWQSLISETDLCVGNCC
jgi:hypothetical protein